MKSIKEVLETSDVNQMSLISDTDEVIKFLHFTSQKSILNEHTTHCRITACHNLFSILNEGEDKVEYLIGNLDILVNRFRNKNPNVQPSTLKVYKSRVKSTLEDYLAWSKDPIAWERSVSERPKTNKLKMKKKEVVSSDIEEEIVSKPVRTSTSSGNSTRKVSFPLRTDFNIEVTLPKDGLSLKELLRLGLFLYPYCKDLKDEDSSQAWPI